MNNTYGTVRPSTVNILNDVDIFYHYRPTRNSDDVSFESFKKLEDPSQMLSQATFESGDDSEDNRLQGMYNLSLPVSIFSQIGFYTIYIKPKEIKMRIKDIGVLAAYSDISGIVVDPNEASEQSSLFADDALNGYRVEYFADDGSGKMMRQDYYRIVTGCNKCEAVTQNLASSSSISNGYRFNASGSLCFITVTPSTAPSYKANATPYIGAAGQEIRFVNTKFDPQMIEVEITRHDLDTISYNLEGTQVRSLDNGLVTTYNDNNEIYAQHEYATVKDNYTQRDIYEVKMKRNGNIDNSVNVNEILNR